MVWNIQNAALIIIGRSHMLAQSGNKLADNKRVKVAPFGRWDLAYYARPLTLALGEYE